MNGVVFEEKRLKELFRFTGDQLRSLCVHSDEANYAVKFLRILMHVLFLQL